MNEIFRFVQESNRIEGIFRDPTPDELDATASFAQSMTAPHVEDVCGLVSVFAPGHRLRDQIGLNVRLGDYIARQVVRISDPTLRAYLIEFVGQSRAMIERPTNAMSLTRHCTRLLMAMGAAAGRSGYG